MIRLLLIALFLATPAAALDICKSSSRYSCVVDGDTIWYRGEKIRMAGYDAPETHSNFCGGSYERRLGQAATKRVSRLLAEDGVSFERIGQDRYGRTLAVFYVRGQRLSDILVSEGLARYWPDGGEFWCR